VKKILLPIFTILLIVSCNISDDNDPCGIPDGALVDPITQTIYIELVDSNGENLITNETYSGPNITAEKNGIIIRPVVFDENQIPGLPDSVRDIIVLQLFGEEGENTWAINLNEEETDTLVIDLKHGTPDECGLFLLEVLSASYNGIEQNVEPFGVFESDSKINFKITVAK
jgi:hypothetical protein